MCGEELISYRDIRRVKIIESNFSLISAKQKHSSSLYIEGKQNSKNFSL